MAPAKSLCFIVIELSKKKDIALFLCGRQDLSTSRSCASWHSGCNVDRPYGQPLCRNRLSTNFLRCQPTCANTAGRRESEKARTARLLRIGLIQAEAGAGPGAEPLSRLLDGRQLACALGQLDVIGFLLDRVEVIPALIRDTHVAPPSACSSRSMNGDGGHNSGHHAAYRKADGNANQPLVEEFFHGALGVGSLYSVAPAVPLSGKSAGNSSAFGLRIWNGTLSRGFELIVALAI